MYTVKLDPDQARDAAEAGAVLLALDVPSGTTFGIDHQVCLTSTAYNLELVRQHKQRDAGVHGG